MLWHRSQASGAISYASSFLGDRAVNAGGFAGFAALNVIQYFSIPLGGLTTDFGDLGGLWGQGGGCAGFGRGVISGGLRASAITAVIEYITIATPGNSVNFGNLSQARYYCACHSNGTRALTTGGNTASDNTGPTNTVDYITIATTGNAADFGDLSTTRWDHGGLSGKTRAITFGGTTTGALHNTIEYFEFDTLSNAIDFGDLAVACYQNAGASNGIRAVMTVANSGLFKQYNKGIQYINVEITGNSQEFGSLLGDISNNMAMANPYRAVFCGGDVTGGDGVGITDRSFVTFSTPGNAVDFGDLLSAVKNGMSFSGN